MKYAYQRNGTPLLMWGVDPSVPHPTRAAETRELGSLSGTTLDGPTLGEPTLVLPAPGAPEPILSGVGGCSCSGTCGCGSGSGLSGIADSIPGGYLTLGALAIGAWWFLRKKR